MNELLSLSLIELTERLRARQASPVELMEAVLARIDETHADLNAVVVRRDPDACLAEARAAEARIARGEARPLEGIPLGVKELEPVGGSAVDRVLAAVRRPRRRATTRSRSSA